MIENEQMFKAQDALNRRTFLQGAGLGMAALVGLMGQQGLATMMPTDPSKRKRIGGLPNVPHFKPKANRVIYLLQSGAPPAISQESGTPLLLQSGAPPAISQESRMPLWLQS